MEELTDREPSTFILRWNPAISSFTMKNYRDAITKYPDGWVSNWSVYEYKNAHKGDFFYMVRVGEGNTGVVFRGEFRSDPYEGDDWAGTDRKRYYVDISCVDFADPDEPATITADKLSEAIPEINWMHGHSGELLSEETAEKLHRLWDKESGFPDDFWDDDEENFDDEAEAFDAEQGHGSHFECIDKDVDSLIAKAAQYIPYSKTVIGCNMVTVKDDNGRGEERNVFLLSKDEKKPLTLRSILVAKEDSNEAASMFPYVVNDRPVELTLEKIDEYGNGIEAVLTCSYKDERSFSFFDVDYALHKKDYKIGTAYPFALSALAYNCEPVPEDQLSFTVDSENMKEIYSKVPEMIDRDEDGHILPATFSTSSLVMCLQTDKRYPDDAQFWSPLVSDVQKVCFLGFGFYQMNIMIFREDIDGESITIPLVAKTSFFKNMPCKGTPVRGFIWMQGKMVDRENDKN